MPPPATRWASSSSRTMPGTCKSAAAPSSTLPAPVRLPSCRRRRALGSGCKGLLRRGRAAH
eukprot:9155552-Alexandrium_andersonii.AAC.1